MMPNPVAEDVPVDPDPVVETPTQPTVRELLALSRAAHVNYHAAIPRMALAAGIVQRNEGDPAEALMRLKAAAATRAQAERMDPLHRNPAWAEEAATHPHQELLVYYLLQLSK